MKLKIIISITFFLSSMFLYSCGRQDMPLKPQEIVKKN